MRERIALAKEGSGFTNKEFYDIIKINLSQLREDDINDKMLEDLACSMGVSKDWFSSSQDFPIPYARTTDKQELVRLRSYWFQRGI